MSLAVNMYIKDDILFVRFKGELDENHVSDLRLRLVKYIELHNIKHLVFNFERLTFLDSSGIGLIIGRYQQLKVIGGDVTICNLNDKIERIIRISGLMKICKISDNEESVLMFVGAR